MTTTAASVTLLSAIDHSLLVLTVTATLVYAAAAMACAGARRASAALRHSVWGIAVLTVLLSPLLLPFLQNRLPRYAPSPSRPQPHSSITSSSAAPARPFVSAAEPRIPAADPLEFKVPVPPEADARRDSPGPAPLSTAPLSRQADSVTPMPSVAVPWRGLLRAAWLAGLLWQTFLMAADSLRLRRFLQQCRPTRNEVAGMLLRQIQNALGLAPRTTLLDSDDAAIPFVAGLFQPMIVLPADASSWPADRLRSVLTHELIHVSRHDVGWQKVARLAAALVWFHPFAWIALRHLRIEAEFATDDAVLAAGEPAIDYADHLLSVIRRASLNRRLLPAVLSMAGRSPAEQRIRAILDPATDRRPATRRQLGAILVFCLAATAGAAWCTPTTGQEAAPSSRGADPERKPQGQVEAAPPVRENVVATPDSRILTTLQEVVAIDVGADETLLEAVRRIAWRYEMPIRLDEDSFRRAGVSTHERPGALSLADVSLRSCLKRLVEAFNDRSLTPITFDPKVKDGALQIVASESPYQRSIEGNERENRLTAIHGTVRTPDGRPAARARIELRSYASNTFALADAEGRFHVPIRLPHRNGLLVLAEEESSGADARMIPYLGGDEDCPALSLTLEPRLRVEALVGDSQGKPVPNAHVAVVSARRRYVFGETGADGRLVFELPRRLPVDLVAAWKDGAGLDYRIYREYLENRRTERGIASSLPGTWTFALTGAGSVKIAMKDEEGRPVAGLKVYPNAVQRVDQIDQLGFYEIGELPQATDAAGEVAFHWIPTWHRGPIWFRHRSPTFASRLITVNPPGTGEQRTEVALSRRVQISGHVRTADGSPVPGARVQSSSSGWVQSYNGDNIVFADHEGGYSIRLDPDHLGMLMASSPDGRLVSPARDDINTAQRIDRQDVDLVVQPATRVHGRIRRPAGLSAPWSVSLRQHGRELSEIPGITLPNPQALTHLIRPYVGHLAATLKEDEFEFFVGPGQFSLQTWPEAKSPQLGRGKTFRIGNEPAFQFDVEFLEPDSAVLKGRVVSQHAEAGTGEARIFARDMATKNFHRSAVAEKDGAFQISRIRQPTLVLAYSADRKFGGTQIVEANEDSTTVSLMPTANVTFRLVDAEGRPVTGKVTLRADMTPLYNGHRGLWISDSSVAPDPDGRVRLTSLIPNMPYRLTIADEGNQNNRTLKETSFAEPGEFDLGDVPVQAAK